MKRLSRRGWLGVVVGAGGGLIALFTLVRGRWWQNGKRNTDRLDGGAGASGRTGSEVASSPAPWTTLVAALGPWKLADRQDSAAFAARLVDRRRPEVPDTVELGDLAVRLERQRREGTIDMRTLSEAERQLVEQLIRLIYDSPQVLAYVLGEPLAGICTDDLERPTRPPSELGW